MADDDFLQPENLPALPEHVGIRMLEADSIDRVVDGLKIAADGAFHLAYWRQDFSWEAVARGIDALRIKLARLARSKSSDEIPTRDPGSMGTLTVLESYQRLDEGLKNAARAARQIASGHRGDLRWVQAANALDEWARRCNSLVRLRNRQKAAPSLILPN